MADIRWLSTSEFAQTAAISLQAAWRALRDSLRGRQWRERHLNVRHVLVAGGRGGLGYEVEAASLPRELTLGVAPASPSPQSGPITERSTARGQNEIVMKRLALITPALQHPAQSRPRSEAVGRASFEALKSPRTLYRWISQYEAHGLRGLARATGCKAAERRVCVSRQFDQEFRAAGYSDDLLAKIGDQSLRDEVSPFIAMLWRRGTLYETEVMERGHLQDLDLSAAPTEDKERLTLGAMQRGEPLIYSGRVSADGLAETWP